MKKINIKLPGGKSEQIPYFEIKSRKKGPTCVISGGMHGDEINGIALVEKFFEKCRKNGIMHNLQGKIIIIPVINQSGFQAVKRRVQHDGKDLNRCFNQRKKSASCLIANTLEQKFYSKANLIIDCHDSGSRSTLLPHPRIASCNDQVCDVRIRRLAIAFNSHIIIEREGKPGMLAVEIPKKYNIPAITLELGGGLKLFNGYLDQAVEGICNMLSLIGMIPRPKIKKHKQFYVKGRFGVPAPASGIISFSKKLGDRVHLNDEIGRLYIPTQGKTIPIKAPMCGLIFSIQHQDVAIKDKFLFSILEDKICHLKNKKTARFLKEVTPIKM